jgi:hypothetical protein
MISIEWVTADVTAFRQPARLAHLFGPCLGVMATRAQRGELVERRKRLAAVLDADAMINRDCGFDATGLQACLAERMLPQLVPA